VLILFLRSGPLLKIDTGAAYIPNPQKANKLGEDAYFIAKDGKSFGELNRCMVSLSPASDFFVSRVLYNDASDADIELWYGRQTAYQHSSFGQCVLTRRRAWGRSRRLGLGFVLSGTDAGDGAFPTSVLFEHLDFVQSGVADGVGGWALSGVDAGEYARLLMQMAQLFAEAKKLDPHPKQVGCRAVRAGACGSSSSEAAAQRGTLLSAGCQALTRQSRPAA